MYLLLVKLLEHSNVVCNEVAKDLLRKWSAIHFERNSINEKHSDTLQYICNLPKHFKNMKNLINTTFVICITNIL